MANQNGSLQKVMDEVVTALTATRIGSGHVPREGYSVRHMLPGVPRQLANPFTFTEIPAVVYNRAVRRVCANGDVKYKRYIRGALLGVGGFAHCYELTSIDSGTVYAAKIVSRAAIRQRPSCVEMLVREFTIQQPLQHENIVRVHNLFCDDYNYYIMSERCAKQTLMHRIVAHGRLPESEARRWMRQLLHAVGYLHDHGIVHLDIKPNNLYIGAMMCLKLGDFGLAQRVTVEATTGLTGRCGTPNYVAPEVINRDGHSFPADIWSIGVVFFVMLCGVAPFQRNSIPDTYIAVTKGTYVLPDYISPDAKSLLTGLLAVSPEHRSTARQLLEHPFFNGTSRFSPTTSVSVEPHHVAKEQCVIKEVQTTQIARSIYSHPKESHTGDPTPPLVLSIPARLQPSLALSSSRVTRSMAKFKRE
jgi:serine/threonine protein kinase